MRRVLSFVLLLAIVWLVLWPNPFAEGAIGHPIGDLADHYWGTWWFGERVLAGESPLHTAQTHLPEGGSLWHPDPLGGLWGLLLRPLGFPLAWNALTAARVLAAALTAFGLGRAFTGRELGGLVAAVVVAASPYAIGLLHGGLSEYEGLALPVLAVWAVLRCLATGERPGLTGLLLALTTAQAFYYGAFALLFLLLGVPGPGWRDRAPTAARVVAVWALMALPLMALAHATLGEGSAFAPHAAPGWAFAELPATDLMSWLRPGPWYHPDTPRLGNPGILHVNYLGWATLALSLWGLWREPRVRAIGAHAAAFAAFALGPVLSWNRAVVRLGGVALVLPMALFYLPGSPLNFIHHPYRIDALLLPLVALFAAAGACALPRALGALAVPVILVESLALSPAPWPLVRTPIPVVAREIPGDGAVLDWPPDATEANRSYLMAQVEHGRPIAAGVNAFLSPTLLRDPLVVDLLRALDRPQARARNRDVPAPGPVLFPPEPGPSRLAALGFSALIVHEEFLSAPERARTRRVLDAALGPPQEEEGELLVYAVHSPP